MTAIITDASGRNAAAPMSPQERKTRIELAASYRLAQRQGWDELIYNHISARVPGQGDHFLINPFGLSFDEVTASNLIKVDSDGAIVGQSEYPVNVAGFVIHSAVHMGRPDIGCVIHLHTEAGMALSIIEDGLLSLTQTAMVFHNRVGFHAYEGQAINVAERERLIEDLGDKAVLILRNHGTLVVGKTIGEAFVTMYLFEKAARAQLLAMASGAKLVRPPPEFASVTADLVAGGFGALESAWQAMIRRLDRDGASFRA